MKKALVILLLLVSFRAFSQSQTYFNATTPPGSNSLVPTWRYDGVVTDSLGHKVYLGQGTTFWTMYSGTYTQYHFFDLTAPYTQTVTANTLFPIYPLSDSTLRVATMDWTKRLNASLTQYFGSGIVGDGTALTPFRTADTLRGIGGSNEWLLTPGMLNLSSATKILGFNSSIFRATTSDTTNILYRMYFNTDTIRIDGLPQYFSRPQTGRTPTLAQDLANKAYVDNAISAGSINIYNSDGTLTGNRTLTIGSGQILFLGNLSSDNAALSLNSSSTAATAVLTATTPTGSNTSTLHLGFSADSTFLSRDDSFGTETQSISFSSLHMKIYDWTQRGLVNNGDYEANFIPTSLNTYQSQLSGIAAGTIATYATTTVLPANTYNNGTSGVDATLTENSNGALTVDGVTPSLNDIILVKNEATQSHNGIYYVARVGSGSQTFLLWRYPDSGGIKVTALFAKTLRAGSNVYIQKGNTLSGSVYYQTTAGIITVGTTNLVYNVLYQPTLISGTNIKTVNSTSLLGSGNIVTPNFANTDLTLTGNRLLGLNGKTLGIGINGTDIAFMTIDPVTPNILLQESNSFWQSQLSLKSGSNGITLQNSFAGSAASLFLNSSVGVFIDYFDASSGNSQSLTIDGSNMTISDQIAGIGLQEAADYSANYTARSYISKGYADATYAASISGTGYSKWSGTTPTFITAIPNGDLANSAITINGNSVSLGSSKTLSLASSDFANQGTTTTLLHGNGSGNPSFGQIVNADITNSTIDLTAKVTGVLPNANTTATTTPTASTIPLWDASVNFSSNAYIQGSTSTATAAGTTTLTVTSTPTQIFTGTLAQTVVLPVASTLGKGFRYTIINQSTGAVTVQSSGANNILIVTGGTVATFETVLNTGTSAASWQASIQGTAQTGQGSIVRSSSPQLTTIGLGTGPQGSTQEIILGGTPSVSQMRLLTGSAPTSPVSGDIWRLTGNSLQFYDGSATNNFVFSQNGQVVVLASTQTTLVSGTKALSITGVTTGSHAYVTLVTPSGTSLTSTYQAVATSGTVTIQANIAAGTINAADGSTVNVYVTN